MTEPRDPDNDDWGFPEVDPASTSLPEEPEGEPVAEGEGAFDTGSDAWWRAQAVAQRAAAAQEPPAPPTPPAAPPPPEEPPPLVAPEVLLPEGTPLDLSWAPPDLTPAGPRREAPTPPAPPAAVSPVPPLPPVEVPPAAPAAPPVPPPAAVPPPRIEEPLFTQLRTEQHEEEEPPRVGPLRAVLGALLAVAGVALVIVAFLVLRGGDDGSPTVGLPTQSAAVTPSASTAPTTGPSPTTSARPSATPSPSAARSTAPAVAPILPVTVLNNSRVHLLAASWARRLNAGGWPTPVKGNYSGGVIAQTTVYYGPGQEASAQRLARQFGFGRVLPRFSGLPGSGLTLVLTRDAA